MIFLVGIGGYIARYHEFIPGIRPVITAIGVWGVLCAIVIIASALMLRRHPDQHSTWGA